MVLIVYFSMDSDLKAFSNNPTDGSMAAQFFRWKHLPIIWTNGSTRTRLDFCLDNQFISRVHELVLRQTSPSYRSQVISGYKSHICTITKKIILIKVNSCLAPPQLAKSFLATAPYRISHRTKFSMSTKRITKRFL